MKSLHIDQLMDQEVVNLSGGEFYARCISSVSIGEFVPPAYNVHLAAFRARFYMEPDISDSGSMISGAAGGRGMGGGGRSTRANA
ncbi:unnamed protein product [Lactuca virosa]|uniref:Uncharacterized protein n=1 Tax=Lactuca virosa TaxID=75947 RepID=A0AAU9NE86_9ASTR|nr:unnamed protein product [Lactuca virosa]